MNKKNKLIGLASVTLAASLCFAVAGPASAEIHYPISGHSFSRGPYSGSWIADTNLFEVTTNSLTSEQYCKAVQDGTNVRYATTSRRTTCHVKVTGTDNAHDDFVEFYQKG